MSDKGCTSVRARAPIAKPCSRRSRPTSSAEWKVASRQNTLSLNVRPRRVLSHVERAGSRSVGRQGDTAGLFVPQRLDRVEPGGLARREVAEDDADAGGEQEGEGRSEE